MGIDKRECRQCGADISKRHWLAIFCWECATERGRHPLKEAAHKEVMKAIRKGALPLATDCACVDCGDSAINYDHRDYMDPLDVAPVCGPCNKKRGAGYPFNLTGEERKAVLGDFAEGTQTKRMAYYTQGHEQKFGKVVKRETLRPDLFE